MKLFDRDPLPDVVRSEVDALAAEYNALVVADGERLARYTDYRDENQLVRNSNIFTEVADTTDYGKQRQMAEPSRHNIPLPFGLALTIKHAFRIAGRLPDVFIDRREETPQERYRSDTMEKIVWAIIRASGGKTMFKDAAWDGSQLGASCFDVYWDARKSLPVIRAVDPAGIVVVKGVEDPHDFQRVYRSWKASLTSVVAEYGGQIFRDQRVGDLLTEIESTEVTVVQVVDKTRRLRFVLEHSKESTQPVPIYEANHNLGSCPYVVIPNIGPERDVWGWADYEMVRALVHYIPTLFSREADLIRAVAGGAYQESGTGQSPAKIMDIVRKGGVLTTKRDSKVEPIPVPEVPDFEPGHADRAVLFLKMLGFAPDAAWGDGNAGSGSDRGLQLQPLIELTEMKQSNWTTGLSRLFAMALRALELNATTAAHYSGIVQKGNRRKPFVIGPFGHDVSPIKYNARTGKVADLSAVVAGDDELDLVDLPRDPRELFAGDYTVRFEWQNRIDPDDPAFVAAELNKFAQGAQSLETTLERLGFNSPEDEMRRIENEAKRFPWINQGMVAMLKAQLAAEQGGAGQGAGGGAPVDPTAALSDSLDSFAGTDTAATDTDLMSGALTGGVGTPFGAA